MQQYYYIIPERCTIHKQRHRFYFHSVFFTFEYHFLLIKSQATAKIQLFGVKMTPLMNKNLGVETQRTWTIGRPRRALESKMITSQPNQLPQAVLLHKFRLYQQKNETKQDFPFHFQIFFFKTKQDSFSYFYY